MCFLVLRQQCYSIQGVLTVVADGSVSEQMEKWASRVNSESVVLVHGVIAKTPELVKSASLMWRFTSLRCSLSSKRRPCCRFNSTT